jgi:hypothetical protein
MNWQKFRLLLLLKYQFHQFHSLGRCYTSPSKRQPLLTFCVRPKTNNLQFWNAPLPCRIIGLSCVRNLMSFDMFIYQILIFPQMYFFTVVFLVFTQEIKNCKMTHLYPGARITLTYPSTLLSILTVIFTNIVDRNVIASIIECK